MTGNDQTAAIESDRTIVRNGSFAGDEKTKTCSLQVAAFE
jgi:hypothetical protein